MELGWHSTHSDETMGWITKESWFDSWQGHNTIPFSIASTPNSWTQETPNRCEVLFP